MYQACMSQTQHKNCGQGPTTCMHQYSGVCQTRTLPADIRGALLCAAAMLWHKCTQGLKMPCFWNFHNVPRERERGGEVEREGTTLAGRKPFMLFIFFGELVLTRGVVARSGGVAAGAGHARGASHVGPAYAGRIPWGCRIHGRPAGAHPALAAPSRHPGGARPGTDPGVRPRCEREWRVGSNQHAGHSPPGCTDQHRRPLRHQHPKRVLYAPYLTHRAIP
jgi:hypothetical protein